jgi:hypothetical protein
MKSPTRYLHSFAVPLIVLMSLIAVAMSSWPGARVTADAAIALPAAVVSPLKILPSSAATRTCAYSDRKGIAEFGKVVGRTVDCALVFNDASTNWHGWEMPWFVSNGNPDLKWANWMRSVKGRTLILTQNLFPSSLNRSNWLDPAASGKYVVHAKTLARNLIAAGLGQVVIRLGHEANGTWYPDSVPASRTGQQKWKAFWAATVRAMRSVPGAHFSFDLTVNYKVRSLNLQDFYPGDSVVDILGLDAYDEGLKQTGGRWATLYHQRGGISDFLQFAASRQKPISFPEWGLLPTNYLAGGGDDPEYMAGMAGLISKYRPVYQTYWYGHPNTSNLFKAAKKSKPIYISHFGRH